MQAGEPLTPSDVKDLSVELALVIIRENLVKHGYDGARIPVDEFYRTLDDFLTEFQAKNARRITNSNLSE